jgi:hypothetical protein
MLNRAAKCCWPRWAIGLALVALLLAAAPEAYAQPQGRIVFTKSFPGSVPAYFEVDLKATGEATYRESTEDADPLKFVLRPEETAAIFSLAQELDYSAAPMRNERKIAFTGDKTIRFEDSTGVRRETKFIHTEDPHAKDLLVWFERIAETERHLIELERTAQFDRLGVNKTLLLFQASYDRGRIVAGNQFLPILKNIASGNKYVHIARARAASLVESIESAGGAASGSNSNN